MRWDGNDIYGMQAGPRFDSALGLGVGVDIGGAGEERDIRGYDGWFFEGV